MVGKEKKLKIFLNLFNSMQSTLTQYGICLDAVRDPFGRDEKSASIEGDEEARRSGRTRGHEVSADVEFLRHGYAKGFQALEKKITYHGQKLVQKLHTMDRKKRERITGPMVQ